MTEQFLKGKVAIVTGANSGIGKSVAIELALRGASVVINYRSRPELTESLLSEITSSGGIAIGAQADVTHLDSLQGVVDLAVKSYGRLDDKVLNVNLKSAFFGTQFAAKQMISQGGGGRVINISSVHEDWPMPNNTAYCLAKGGLRMLTRTAGVELAPHGVTVVNVGPGAVNTPINAQTINNPELLAKLNSAIPMGRMAEPSEIAAVVAFLASDAASYITATSIFADGGIMQSSPGL